MKSLLNDLLEIVPILVIIFLAAENTIDWTIVTAVLVSGSIYNTVRWAKG